MSMYDAIERVFTSETTREGFECAGDLDMAAPIAIIAQAIESLDDLTRAVVVAAIDNQVKAWVRDGSPV